MRVPALAIGAGAGVMAALALVPATSGALAELDAVRQARSAIEEAARRPVAPILPPERMIRASSRTAADEALARQVRRLAGGAGVLVEAAAPVAGGPLARIQLRLSGSEAAVLGLADRIERSAPLVRFTRWRVEGTGGGVRLTGEVAAAWG